MHYNQLQPASVASGWNRLASLLKEKGILLTVETIIVYSLFPHRITLRRRFVYSSCLLYRFNTWPISIVFPIVVQIGTKKHGKIGTRLKNTEVCLGSKLAHYIQLTRHLIFKNDLEKIWICQLLLVKCCIVGATSMSSRRKTKG